MLNEKGCPLTAFLPVKTGTNLNQLNLINQESTRTASSGSRLFRKITTFNRKLYEKWKFFNTHLIDIV